MKNTYIILILILIYSNILFAQKISYIYGNKTYYAGSLNKSDSNIIGESINIITIDTINRKK